MRIFRTNSAAYQNILGGEAGLNQRIMNLPNILTLFRIFLIPIFVLVFFSSITHSLLISVIIFLLAGLSDVLDGYIARKNNLVTKWGMVADPLADKLMLLTTLTCLTIKSLVPFLIVGMVAAKEIFMIISGMLLYKNDTVIPSNIFGKLTTILFYLSISTIYFNKEIGVYFLYIAFISTIVALINYLVIYIKNRHLKSNDVK